MTDSSLPPFPFPLPSLPNHPSRPQAPPHENAPQPSAPSDVASLQSDLLQSRAQRKMLVKELKFVREQLAYHRKQLARVEADKAEMAHDLHQLKLRVAQAEDDKTKVMTRSVAEKHMLANEINALEDTFMAGITGGKQSALEQAQAQVVMLRKEVRYLRTQFVGVRQELARDRKTYEEQLGAKDSEIQELLAKFQLLPVQASQPSSSLSASSTNGSKSLTEPEHSNNIAQLSPALGADDDEADAGRLKKQRDMFEKENVALAKQVSQLHSRVQQLECEILKHDASLRSRHSHPSSPPTEANGTAPPRQSSGGGAVSESVLHSQQDSVRMLKQMLDDARREEHDLRDSSEANLNVLRGTIREMEDSMIRAVKKNNTLASELDEKLDEVRLLQEQVQEAQMERIIMETDNPLLNAAGRLSSSLASSAKDATSKAFFKLQRQIG
eukprot:c1789_g1_i1.p1 GENE.c1789_g1_i1~~c1789_g1_i1.p1  ORF type:complete len:441 (-),score=114.59 c1789_g1_i1:353-1675(-)